MRKSDEEIADTTKLLNLVENAAPEVIEGAAKHHLATYGTVPHNLTVRFKKRFKRSMRDVGASFSHIQPTVSRKKGS